MSYVPEEAPLDATPADLVAYIRRELFRISQAFQSPVLKINVQYVEPNKPRDGQLAMADGTEWNPGAGAGMYVYLNGAWRKVTHAS